MCGTFVYNRQTGGRQLRGRHRQGFPCVCTQSHVSHMCHGLYPAAVTGVSHEVRKFEHQRSCPTDYQMAQAQIWVCPGMFGTDL